MRAPIFKPGDRVVVKITTTLNEHTDNHIKRSRIKLGDVYEVYHSDRANRHQPERIRLVGNYESLPAYIFDHLPDGDPHLPPVPFKNGDRVRCVFERVADFNRNADHYLAIEGIEPGDVVTAVHVFDENPAWFRSDRGDGLWLQAIDFIHDNPETT